MDTLKYGPNSDLPVHGPAPVYDTASGGNDGRFFFAVGRLAHLLPFQQESVFIWQSVAAKLRKCVKAQMWYVKLIASGVYRLQ